MKKFFFMAALVMAAAFTLTSCGSDEPKETVTASATYSLNFSQDLLDACNVFITYKAENGRNVMEAVTGTMWTKTVTSDKFPAEFGVMYKFSAKSESELTKDNYELYCKLSLSSRTSKGASFSNDVIIINNNNVAKDKVISTLEKLSGKSVGIKVTKDGYFSQADNLNYD